MVNWMLKNMMLISPARALIVYELHDLESSLEGKKLTALEVTVTVIIVTVVTVTLTVTYMTVTVIMSKVTVTVTTVTETVMIVSCESDRDSIYLSHSHL